jgi:hypothetical protein
MLAEDVERAAEREFAVADMRAIGFDGIAAPVGRLPVTTPGSEGWADLMVVDGGYVVVPSL